MKLWATGRIHSALAITFKANAGHSFRGESWQILAIYDDQDPMMQGLAAMRGESPDSLERARYAQLDG